MSPNLKTLHPEQSRRDAWVALLALQSCTGRLACAGCTALAFVGETLSGKSLEARNTGLPHRADVRVCVYARNSVS